MKAKEPIPISESKTIFTLHDGERLYLEFRKISRPDGLLMSVSSWDFGCDVVLDADEIDKIADFLNDWRTRASQEKTEEAKK